VASLINSENQYSITLLLLTFHQKCYLQADLKGCRVVAQLLKRLLVNCGEWDLFLDFQLLQFSDSPCANNKLFYSSKWVTFFRFFIHQGKTRNYVILCSIWSLKHWHINNWLLTKQEQWMFKIHQIHYPFWLPVFLFYKLCTNPVKSLGIFNLIKYSYKQSKPQQNRL